MRRDIYQEVSVNRNPVTKLQGAAPGIYLGNLMLWVVRDVPVFQEMRDAGGDLGAGHRHRRGFP